MAYTPPTYMNSNQDRTLTLTHGATPLSDPVTNPNSPRIIAVPNNPKPSPPQAAAQEAAIARARAKERRLGSGPG